MLLTRMADSTAIVRSRCFCYRYCSSWVWVWQGVAWDEGMEVEVLSFEEVEVGDFGVQAKSTRQQLFSSSKRASCP
eukprot:scaffold2705_cov140-Skeletonema_dohrnii-CCMP3373.AAC.2